MQMLQFYCCLRATDVIYLQHPIQIMTLATLKPPLQLYDELLETETSDCAVVNQCHKNSYDSNSKPIKSPESSLYILCRITKLNIPLPNQIYYSTCFVTSSFFAVRQGFYHILQSPTPTGLTISQDLENKF